MTPFWDFSIRQTRIAFWRTYGSDWQSLDWSSIQKRRAGSIRAVCRREPETKSRRQTRDVRFPGLYTYQRKERDRAIYRATQDDPQAHAGQAATDQAGAPHAHARSRASNWRMAQIGRAGLLQLPRSTRKPRKPRGVPEPHAWALAADPSPPEPEASTLLDTHANAGPAMASSTACAPSISR